MTWCTLISGLFRVTELIYFAKVVESVTGIAHFITSNASRRSESLQYLSFVCFLLQKDLTFQNLFIDHTGNYDSHSALTEQNRTEQNFIDIKLRPHTGGVRAERSIQTIIYRHAQLNNTKLLQAM